MLFLPSGQAPFGKSEINIESADEGRERPVTLLPSREMGIGDVEHHVPAAFTGHVGC